MKILLKNRFHTPIVRECLRQSDYLAWSIFVVKKK